MQNAAQVSLLLPCRTCSARRQTVRRLRGSEFVAIRALSLLSSLSGCDGHAGDDARCASRHRHVFTCHRSIHPLTQFADGKVLEGGITGQALVVKPNFLPNPPRVTAGCAECALRRA